MDNHSDKFALAALYEATDGPNWGRNDNWCTDAPLSEWYGVTVDTSGRVTELNLKANYLRLHSTRGKSKFVRVTTVKRMCGSIPGELAQLTNLRKLDLSVNMLTGPIPAELARLANLRNIGSEWQHANGPNTCRVGATGEPEEIGSQYGNLLTGPIPVELAQLTNLRNLNSITC